MITFDHNVMKVTISRKRLPPTHCGQPFRENGYPQHIVMKVIKISLPSDLEGI